MIGDPKGKPSVSHWEKLAVVDGRSLLRFRPETGRTHQLRVHMAAIGHPLLGDALYAPPEVCGAAPRLLLHAERLMLLHPASGAELDLLVPAPF